MKYRPKQCPECSHNRFNGAWCDDAAYRNQVFKGESQKHCYAFIPKKKDISKV